MSEAAKIRCWQLFQSGDICIICATDAAGMGCNISDVKFVVSFGCPKSIGTVVQCWGRGGRDRTTEAVCLLLLPKWAFCPSNPSAHLHQQLQCGRKPGHEAKTDIVKRARLDPTLESFVNISSNPSQPVCAHSFVRNNFAPKTLMNVYSSLTPNASVVTGSRSQRSPFELLWTVIDLRRTPPATRCCYTCNTELVKQYAASDNHDPRLRTFASEFLQPLAPIRPSESRLSSSMSTQSDGSNLSSYMPLAKGTKVTEEQKDRLRVSLTTWRQRMYVKDGSPSFFSVEMYLPPTQLNIVIKNCSKYCSTKSIDVCFLKNLVKLDSAEESDWEDLANIILEWRESIQLFVTPTSQRCMQKKTRSGVHPSPSVPQPIFTPMPPQPQPQPVLKIHLPPCTPSLVPQPSPQPSLMICLPPHTPIPVDDNVFGNVPNHASPLPLPTPTTNLPATPMSLPPRPYMYTPYQYHYPSPFTPNMNMPTTPMSLPMINPYQHLVTPMNQYQYGVASYPYFYPAQVCSPLPSHSAIHPVENSSPPPNDPNPSSSTLP